MSQELRLIRLPVSKDIYAADCEIMMVGHQSPGVRHHVARDGKIVKGKIRVMRG